MRKLFLASFTAKTGKLEFNDFRLIAAECKDFEHEEHQRETATDVFKQWFIHHYPESILQSVIVHPTIGGEVKEDRALRKSIILDPTHSGKA